MKIILLLTISFFSLLVSAQVIDDLFVSVMPDSYRNSYPLESKTSFEVHLKDTYKIFPTVDRFKKSNLIDLTDPKFIQGKITYANSFPAPYKYAVINENQVIKIKVNIGFFTTSSKDIQFFKAKIKAAELIWNQSRWALDFDYQFEFNLVKDLSKADFKVTPKNTTRGPYFLFWGRDWDDIVVAHEIGHMLGLGDEYETMTGQSHCLVDSIMCTNSPQSFLMKHHLYFVLRRLFN